MTNEDFKCLSCIQNIDGVLSFNMSVTEQIVMQNLRNIRGNISGNISGEGTASLLVNVIGGDIIFPNLRTITRGNAVFQITNGVCGYLSIDWTRILLDGSLDSQSINCSSKYYSSCMVQCLYNEFGNCNLIYMAVNFLLS